MYTYPAAYFGRALAASAFVCVVASAFVSIAVPALAATPHLVVTTRNWTSSHGNCTRTVPRATIEGVDASVKRRIDAILARMLVAAMPDATAPASWESTCAKDVAENASFAKETGRPFAEFAKADWTRGLARGRWLSARLHFTEYAGGAHPEDSYASVTFDLTHGGYPVPTNGFYTTAQRARFNALLLRAQIASLHQAAEPVTPDILAALTADATDRHVAANQILLTATGIEVTSLGNDEASRNWIVATPYGALSGIGTPGGPLSR